MSVNSTQPSRAEIDLILSTPRLATYLTAAAGDAALAIELYGWNASVSAALMLPAHFAEVSTRNAVDQAITAVYGASWPWNTAFIRTLPRSRGYDAQRDLVQTAAAQPTTGKVIAELKFVFWEKMFTARNAGHLWNRQILSLFPNSTMTNAADLRDRVRQDLEVIRAVRNRIAHHEPVFARDLADALVRMFELVRMRSVKAEAWLRSMENASAVLGKRPIP